MAEAEPTNPYMKYLETAAPSEENPYAKYTARREEPIEVAPAEDPGMKQVAPGVFIRGDRSLANYITGGAEVAASILSSAVAEPLAGAAAISPPEGMTSKEAAGAVREARTYQPRGEVGQEMLADVGSFLEPVGEWFGGVETGLGEATLEATGSSELAAAAHTAPTALVEILGLGLLRRPSQAALRAAKAQERMRIDSDMTPDQVARQEIEPEMRSHEQIAKDLREKTDISRDVRPDQEIIEAAEGLGVDLNPSHYSTNEAYRLVEQSVKSQPKSRLLAAREVDAIVKLGERADELIGEFGGSLDKSLLDVKVRGQVDRTIKDLKKAAENIYKKVNYSIKTRAGAGAKVNARASKAYLNQRLKELGDDVSGLSKAERQLHQVLNADRPPTYARLDQLRQDVGAGFKQRGQFADDLSGNLDQVYSALIRDQQGFADALNVGKTFSVARKWVETRKQLEKQAMKMFGRDMNKSFLPQLTQASTALTKGQIDKFTNLMDALPENLRTPAAATLLNDLFMHGTRSGGSLGQGFARAYGSLQRNPGAKAELFKYLPKEAQRRFDAIGKVSTGLFRAKALENTSRTARDILQALENGGMVARITDKASDTVLGRMTFVPGPTRWIASGMKASKTVAKETFDNVRAADNLMASNDFSRAIGKAMEGDVKQAEIMLKRSAVWRAFRNTLGEGTKAQLLAMGPIAWLTQQEGQPVGQ